MGKKIWITQIPIVLWFAGAYLVLHWGEQGRLHNAFLRNKVFPALRTVSGTATNLKFRVRGPTESKNPIVIVAIDDQSLSAVGRWPWHRDAISYLIEKIFQAGARVVGLDMVFSEADQRIPDELKTILEEKKMGELVHAFETDPHLQQVISKYKDKLVLGWSQDQICQPAYETAETCPYNDPNFLASLPPDMDRFSIQDVQMPSQFDPAKTPVMTAVGVLANLPMYAQVAQYLGTFGASPDPDGFIRRTNLFFMAKGRAFPALSLEMARIVRGDNVRLVFDDTHRVKSLGFVKAQKEIPVTSQGVMEINFQGPGESFPYLSALSVMGDEEQVDYLINRKLASTSKTSLLKDAIVLVGVTALAVYDMRSFPFESNIPGVEGHANILDNLLSDNAILPGSNYGIGWLLAFLVIGAVLFAIAIERLESIPALMLFAGVIATLGFADMKLLFANNINLSTSFIYLEYFIIFLFTLAAKYILEEKQKKFIHGAFGRYVSPAMVDTIVKDPTKLSLGGEKRELTIMFSDVRNFTTLSEKMDPKHLAAFLNEYLGRMTDIIVLEHLGTLDKYIGDAIMAFWGAPIEQKHHATNATKASIKMLQELNKIRPEFLKKYGIDVQVGVGLNSGSVSVGNMGSEKNFNYTVLGDHVNLASRLEGLTKYYGAEIVTSRFTMDSIKEAGGELPVYRALDDVKVKGKKSAVELVELFAIEQPKAAIELFHEARKLYRARQWHPAIAKFQEAGRIFLEKNGKKDGPCEMYVERCQYFLEHAPAEDWDGTWEMKSK